MIKQSYWGQFYWGPRPEDPDVCAGRLAGLLADLADVHHALGSWRVAMLSGVTIEVETSRGEQLTEALLEGRNRSDVGSQPIDELGYTLRLHNEATRIESLIGCYSQWVPNNFLLGPIISDGEEDLCTYAYFIGVVRAVARHLDPDHGVITTEEYEELIRDDPAFTLQPGQPRSGWMTYVSQRLPVNRRLRSEALPIENLGHLFIATEVPFDAANSEHVESAQQLWKNLTKPKWRLGF